MATNVERFEAFLRERGAEVLAPTNPYELVRFDTPQGVGIIYEGKRGRSYVGEAAVAWKAFRNGGHWRAEPKRSRRPLTPVQRTLMKRDGTDCWFCGLPFSEDLEPTVEHLVPVVHGGPDHVSNLVLACEACNADAGHKSVAEKVKMRERRRMEALRHHCTGRPTDG